MTQITIHVHKHLTLSHTVSHLTNLSPLSLSLSLSLSPTHILSHSLIQLQLYRKLLSILSSSSRVSPNVIQNLRTIVVYHVLHGLLPLLGAGPSAPSTSTAPGPSADRHDAGGGLSKLIGHIKFSVPLVDWTRQALEDLRILFEELASEGTDEVCLYICMYMYG